MRIETRTYAASTNVSWITSERSYPGQPRSRNAAGVRGHGGVESMHWLLDVVFKDHLSRYRTSNGAKNLAAVRRFALDLVRANKAKGSVKTKRKAAGWNPDFLLEILQQK